jgi:hypothetical protein
VLLDTALTLASFLRVGGKGGMENFRAAPLSQPSRVITALVFVWITAVAVAALSSGFMLEGLVVVGILAVVLLTGLLAVRGYALGAGYLIVRHPLWSTRINLSDLEGASPMPELAEEFSVSLFSTRGTFGQIGYGHKNGLGVFLMYVTDPSAAVVLRFSARKPIIVSPASPDGFLDAISGEVRSGKKPPTAACADRGRARARSPSKSPELNRPRS